MHTSKTQLEGAVKKYSKKLLNTGLTFELKEDDGAVRSGQFKLEIRSANKEKWDIKWRGDPDPPDPATGERIGKVRNPRWKLYEGTNLNSAGVESPNPEDLLRHILDNLPDQMRNVSLF